MYERNRRGTAADVYSFGCLMIELFGQRRVWGNLVTAQIMLKVCGKVLTPPAVNHLPLHLQDVCRSCCKLDAMEHPDITAVLKQLDVYSE